MLSVGCCCWSLFVRVPLSCVGFAVCRRLVFVDCCSLFVVCCLLVVVRCLLPFADCSCGLIAIVRCSLRFVCALPSLPCDSL